ncbi:hypothetical protein Pla100_01330 [Neorhodopirellula pilleata]|uniref:Uncharacterized protein n=1 Tax=Neorhodopirellula pilleata TaxID=2714738 RepID=A0A5C6AT88_9BACT|nr:hypothetical protein Pla100_01330 [Neorhodopirellula pilleata]
MRVRLKRGTVVPTVILDGGPSSHAADTLKSNVASGIGSQELPNTSHQETTCNRVHEGRQKFADEPSRADIRFFLLTFLPAKMLRKSREMPS